MALASVGYSILHVMLALVMAFQLYFAVLIVVGIRLITVEHEKQTGIYTAIGLVNWPSKGNTWKSKLRHKEVKNLHTLVRFYFILLLAGDYHSSYLLLILHPIRFGLFNFSPEVVQSRS